MDIRTETEKARDAKHCNICAEYKKLRSQQPAAKPHRLFSVLAEKNGMTMMGIRNIIKRNGLY